MNQALRLILLGLLMVFMQVFLANQMVLYNVATPYIFLLFLFFFPIDSPKAVQYLVGFGVGLFVDWLSLQGPLGLHAFCATLIMGIRLPILGLIGSSTGVASRSTGDIRLEYQQRLWYLTFYLPLIFIYVFCYIYLEAMSFTLFWVLLWKVVATTVYTLLLCLILTYLFFQRSGSTTR